MSERLDITDVGLVLRDEMGEVVLPLTWVPGAGEGALAVVRRGATPLDVMLDVDGLRKLAAAATRAHVAAACMAAAAGQERCVPRRATDSDLPG